MSLGRVDIGRIFGQPERNSVTEDFTSLKLRINQEDERKITDALWSSAPQPRPENYRLSSYSYPEENGDRYVTDVTFKSPDIQKDFINIANRLGVQLTVL